VGRGGRRQKELPAKPQDTLQRQYGLSKSLVQTRPTGPKFYALPRIRRIKNDLKKAGRAEYDIAVNAVLKMVGAHIGRKKR